MEERAIWPAFIGLVIGTPLICRQASTTFASDDPYLTSASVLACSGLAIIAWSRFLPRQPTLRRDEHRYEAVPLRDLGESQGPWEPSPRPQGDSYPAALRTLRIFAIVLITSLCLRVESIRQILANVQCSSTNYEPLVPFCFALWDYYTIRRHKKIPTLDDEDSSVYEALHFFATRGPYSYLIASCLVSFGSMLALGGTRAPRSTFVCSASMSWFVPLLQLMGTLLDIIIIFAGTQLLTRREGRGVRSTGLQFSSLSWTLLFASAILFCVSLVSSIFGHNGIFHMTTQFFWASLAFSIVVAVTVLSASVLIFTSDVLTPVMTICFVSAAATATSNTWQGGHPFPPESFKLAFLGTCLAIFGLAAHFHVFALLDQKKDSAAHPLTKRVSLLVYFPLLAIFLLWTGFWAPHHDWVSFHPADMLVYEAELQHDAYLLQAANSTSMREAVQKYADRYGKYPPPGFDRWYSYAMDRNGVIIDDYDSMMRDLAPFWSLTPEQIRQRTWEAISTSEGDVVAVNVRNGRASMAPNPRLADNRVLTTAIDMIAQFARFLPDMDLAFNLNTRPRVVAPYGSFASLLKNPDDMTLYSKTNNIFSEDRAEHWDHLSGPQNDQRSHFTALDSEAFFDFASVGCHPSSAARISRDWDRGRMCYSCVARHSLGGFLSGWEHDRDTCHQPDLRHLHDLYMPQNHVGATHELYPIFSHTKVHGFNDILYPHWSSLGGGNDYSPDDGHPDVPFEEKQSTLFFRGPKTDSGQISHARMQGSMQHRTDRLLNGVQDRSRSQPLLLPAPLAPPGKLKYIPLTTTTLNSLLSTDVQFVDPATDPPDFQTNWRYKYLLDLDDIDAGSQQNFLPLLRSRCLPFKASILQEWWHDRVTPWAHFVPIDVRGHGLWATLAYFTGVLGEANGQTVNVTARDDIGVRIAENGREWANRVLRREDMEIYFFRLLLEWGRLTDDRRDEIGFDGVGNVGDESQG